VLRELPSEPEWLWRGYLAPGNLTMLAGHPFAGKTMLAAGLLQAIERGDPFLGQTTSQASALIISEEDDLALQQRARLFDLFESASEFLGRSESLLLEWSELIAAATERARDAGHRLLVVDTFPGLAGLADEQENDAGAIAHRLRPLQQAAADGLAVLFLHHMNGYNQPRGSKAFRGMVDISIRLLRKTQGSHVLRLESESRFPTATPLQLKAELVPAADSWFYRSLNVKTSGGIETASGATDERLWRALLDAKTCLRYADFDQVDGLSDDIAKKRLPGWFLAGKVRRDGRGTKADPYCWYPLTT
jgi:hypothetical protein